MPKSNSADALKIHYNTMKKLGVWPEINSSIFYRIRGFATYFLAVGLTLTMVIEVVDGITDFARLSETLYIFITIIAYLIKLATITYNKKKFLKMIDFLKNPIFLSYPENLDHYMAKTIKIILFLVRSLQYLAQGVVVLFAIYPVVDHNKPLAFPFPYELGRYRLVMYVFQIVAIDVTAWNNSCLDTIVPSLVGIGTAHLDILSKLIVQILRVGDDDNPNRKENEQIIKKKLKQSAEYHLAIIEYVESIEDIYSFGLLSQCLASILVICNTLFQFVFVSTRSTQFFMLAFYFCGATFEIFIACWYGNELMLKSIHVAEACYMSDWYKHDKAVCKYLFIVMERSKRPLAITAMKFSKLSLTAFTSILRWSYSYLTLLLNMYSKNKEAHHG